MGTLAHLQSQHPCKTRESARGLVKSPLRLLALQYSCREHGAPVPSLERVQFDRHACMQLPQETHLGELEKIFCWRRLGGGTLGGGCRRRRHGLALLCHRPPLHECFATLWPPARRATAT